jgi:hypothetical protein
MCRGLIGRGQLAPRRAHDANLACDGCAALLQWTTRDSAEMSRTMCCRAAASRTSGGVGARRVARATRRGCRITRWPGPDRDRRRATERSKGFWHVVETNRSRRNGPACLRRDLCDSLRRKRKRHAAQLRACVSHEQGAGHKYRPQKHQRDTGDEPPSRETRLERVYEDAVSVLVNLLDRSKLRKDDGEATDSKQFERDSYQCCTRKRTDRATLRTSLLH